MPTPTTQLIGHDWDLQYSLDGTVFTTLGAIDKLRASKIKVPEVGTTKINDNAKRRQAGIPDYGEFQLDIRYDKAMNALILGWIKARTSLCFKAICKDGAGAVTNTTAPFNGYVAEFDPFGEINNTEVLASITLAIDGELGWTPGA